MASQVNLPPSRGFVSDQDIWTMMNEKDSEAYNKISKFFIEKGIERLPDIHFMPDPWALLSAAHASIFEKAASKGASVAYGLINPKSPIDKLVTKLGKATLLMAISGAHGVISFPVIGAAIFAVVMYFDDAEKQEVQDMRNEIAASMQAKLGKIRSDVEQRIQARKDYEVAKTAVNDNKSTKQDDMHFTTIRRNAKGQEIRIRVKTGNIIAAREALRACPNIENNLISRLSEDDLADVYASYHKIVDAMHGTFSAKPDPQIEAEILAYVQLLLNAGEPVPDEARPSAVLVTDPKAPILFNTAQKSRTLASGPSGGQKMSDKPKSKL